MSQDWTNPFAALRDDKYKSAMWPFAKLGYFGHLFALVSKTNATL